MYPDYDNFHDKHFPYSHFFSEHLPLLYKIFPGERWYQIDIDVSTLTFTHHPLFSKEHVLQARLQELYSNYCRKQKQALSVHLTEKASFF